MQRKTCSKCNQEKDIDLFVKNYRKLGAYTNRCKSCRTEYQREYSARNLLEINKKSKIRRDARKLRAIQYLGGKCNHCQQVVHPAAFDFHHVDPTTKDIEIGNLMTLSDENVFKELDNCILLCANCHRIEHFTHGYR